METKFKILLLIVFLTMSVFVRSQGIYTNINFNNEDVLKLTGHHGFGKIFPINENFSFIIIEFGHIGIINNNTGDFEEFNEKNLEKAIDNFLSLNYKKSVQRYDLNERMNLPYCRRNQFQYLRFYQLNDQFACQVDIPLKVLINQEHQNVLFHFIVFFDEKMVVKEVYVRDKYDGPGLFSSSEGFFLDNENYYVGKNNHDINSKPNFVHFRKNGIKYELIGELSNVPENGLLNYFPGRHLTAFKIKDRYYINNGKSLYVFSADLANYLDKIDYKIKSNELLSDLKIADKNTLVGLRTAMHPDGAAKSNETYLFISDLNFQMIDHIEHFNSNHFRINSLEVQNGMAYLHLFNKTTKTYVLKRIKIPPLAN